MKRQNRKIELTLLNFDKNEYRFYSLELIRFGYGEYHVISSYGKLGTKGRESLHRFKGKEAPNEAYKYNYQ